MARDRCLLAATVFNRRAFLCTAAAAGTPRQLETATLADGMEASLICKTL